MKMFDKIINEAIERLGGLITEDDLAPIPSDGGGSALPSNQSSNVPMGDMGGDTGNMGDFSDNANNANDDEGLDNEQKREADPREYTRSVLTLLTDKAEGITPEMFNDFIDSVNLAITKVKNKQDVKKFYGDFYEKMTKVLEIGEEIKDIFKQVSDIIKDVVGAEYEPDNAGGGVGMSGPSGPGVN